MIFPPAVRKFPQYLEICSFRNEIAWPAFPLDRYVLVDFGKREEILRRPLFLAAGVAWCGEPGTPDLPRVGSFGTIIATSTSRKVFLNKRRHHCMVRRVPLATCEFINLL